MARRKRVNLCKCGKPARKGFGTTLCAVCYAKLGRPKAACLRCDELVPSDTRVGRRCRDCISEVAHAARIGKTFNLTPEKYALLLAAQGGKCAICHRKPISKRLACDHDHKCCPGPVSCGECVRGLLCRNCNRNVLGGLREDIDALKRAIAYLENPPAKEVFNLV